MALMPASRRLEKPLTTEKHRESRSRGSQDGPYLYVYSPDSGQNIYTQSAGEYGGNLNWFERHSDLGYSGGDIEMYAYQIYSTNQKRLFTLVNH
jgi:hypothetical protein